MNRVGAAVGSLVWLMLAPGVVAGLLPWWLSDWDAGDAGPAWVPVRVVGGLLIVAGAAALLHAFARFAIDGLGTPAPVAPTQELVVTGVYRYVRNPMYVAVLALIVGQARCCWSVPYCSATPRSSPSSASVSSRGTRSPR